MKPMHSAFAGERLVASGDLIEVALVLQEILERGETEPLLLIDNATGNNVALSLHGTPAQLRARLERQLAAAGKMAAPAPRSGPGRPKLGVVSREVSLLPRHWEWLAGQPGGASASLRRLVEQVRRDGEASDRARRARDAAYRFMTVMAGDRPGYEEAIRALFAGDDKKLEQQIRRWPKDIRAHAARFVETARKAAHEAERVEGSRKGS